MPLTVTAPSPLNGATLRTELAAAGINLTWRDVVLRGNQLTFQPLDESQRPTVTQVLAAHSGADDPAVANGSTLRQQAQQALAANRTYAALATPTAAQTTAQVQRLSRQQNAIIRLLLGDLTGTD